MADEESSDAVEPRWRVRRPDQRRWRRSLHRKLAQAEVTAPDGSRYHVRILRNLPFRDSPLGPFDGFVPQHVSLPVLVAANLYARGRTGWSVQILRTETPWRAAHVILTKKVRGGAEVADIAVAMATAVQHGARPWEDTPPDWTVGSVVKKVMNWD